MTAPLRAGVVGVGSMGTHHARVYASMKDVELVGVCDRDTASASAVADRYDTTVRDRATLLSSVDLVSVAVPTTAHYAVASDAIDAGVATLVEKPLVDRPERGRDLVAQAREAGVLLATGHVERFNPAVAALADVVAGSDLVGVTARRLGPPVDDDRAVHDGVALDLMVHDMDVVRWLVGATGSEDETPTPANASVVDATGTEEYASALLDVDGVTTTVTASRRTQRKVRDLLVSAEDFAVALDYTDRSVRIHRRSLPSYATAGGDLQYRQESVIERPTVENGEPLARELRAVVDAVREGTPPPVTGEDGLRAVELAHAVRQAAATNRRRTPEVTN